MGSRGSGNISTLWGMALGKIPCFYLLLSGLRIRNVNLRKGGVDYRDGSEGGSQQRLLISKHHTTSPNPKRINTHTQLNLTLLPSTYSTCSRTASKTNSQDTQPHLLAAWFPRAPRLGCIQRSSRQCPGMQQQQHAVSVIFERDSVVLFVVMQRSSPVWLAYLYDARYSMLGGPGLGVLSWEFSSGL